MTFSNVHSVSQFECLRSRKMKASVYYEKAEKYYSNGEYSQALNYFTKSYQLEENNDCLNYLGCCYLELNDLVSACKIFKSLIKNCPDWERPLFNLGRLYLKQKKFKKALSYFQAALSLNCNNEDTYFYLGVYYEKMNEYETAKTYYIKSLSINTEQSESHLNLGMCYLKLDDYDNAFKEFELAYKYDNDCRDAIRNQGLVLVIKKEYAEALKKFLMLFEVEPDDTRNMFDIAFCYYRIRQLKNAKRWLEKLITIKPNHEDANSLLEHIKNQLPESING